MLYFKLEVYQIDKLSAKIFVFSLLAVIKEKTAVRCLQGHQDRFLADKRTQGGLHHLGVLTLLLPCSILQNSGMTMVFPVLPLVAALWFYCYYL